jgi:hypothetical protein
MQKRQASQNGSAFIVKRYQNNFKALIFLYILMAVIAESADGMYVGAIQTIGTGQIRVVSTADLQFALFADIVMRHRIF